MYDNKTIGKVIALLSIIAFVFFLFTCIVKVPAGYVAVQYSMNGGIKDEVLTQGWHIVSPTTKATKYSVGLEQSYLTADKRGDSRSDDSFEASTSEGKAVTIDLTYTYQYDPAHVTEVFIAFKGQDGIDVRDSFTKPNIIAWTKEVIARYPVTDILGAERANINSELTNYLAGKFEKYGINITNASLINVDVDDETRDAINAKINAQQAKETATIVNQTALEKSENDVKVAEMNAKKQLIDAEAEAEANKVLQSSLTDGVIQKMWVEKWNGQLPTYMTDDGSSIMVGFND